MRRSRRKSHCAQILELLADRRPHTHEELYAIGCVAHSRIADLRKRGYVIDQHKDGDHYVYTLLSAPEALPGGGSSEPNRDSWFADRAPAFTAPEAAGSTPAPRSPSNTAGALAGVAEVIRLLEYRGFLEATDERIAELPDDSQASLFDELEEAV